MKLEMRFEPTSWKTGGMIALIASLLTIGLFAAGLFFVFKSGGLQDSDPLSDVEKEAEPKPVVAPVKGKK
jgi:hypothetical protein